MNDTLKHMVRTGFVREVHPADAPNWIYYNTTVGHLREYDRRWSSEKGRVLTVKREIGHLSLIIQRGTDNVTFAPLPTAVGDSEANRKLVGPDDDLMVTLAIRKEQS